MNLADPAVFVIDDDAALRESLCTMVRQRRYLALGCASAEEFLERHGSHRAGCVITDLRMPSMSGLELQEELLRRGSLLPVIVISGFANISSTVRMIRNGALTVLEKPFLHEDLFQAVETALAQNASAINQALLRDELAARFALLTSDERQVMELVIAGLPNKAIARRLGMGQRTVDRRRNSICAKLKAGSVGELATLVAEYSACCEQASRGLPPVCMSARASA